MQLEKTNRKNIIALSLLLILQAVIAAPHIGAGFITDDFNWIDNVVRQGEVEYLRAFTITTGFFRPVVGLSFASQYALHGMNPMAFGIFNLLLHLFNIILVYLLLSVWEKTKALALPAAVLFALNAKAVNMAVGWISGRTTLLFSFFMLLSFYALLKGRGVSGGGSRLRATLRFFVVGVFYLAALLSKETAAAAPIFVFLFTLVTYKGADGSPSLLARIKKSVVSVLPFILPFIAYFLLRFGSDAFTPFNSPSYYRYSFAPGLILKNISEYIIRGGLLDIYIVLIVLILFWFFKVQKKNAGQTSSTVSLSQIPSQDSPVLSRVRFDGVGPGVLWFICFLLPMLPLAARSDLYAYFPQVGLHVVFLLLIFPLLGKMGFTDELTFPSPRKWPRNVLFIALSVILVVWSGYLWSRAAGECVKAENSALFTAEVVASVSSLDKGARVLIVDGQAAGKVSSSKSVSHGFGPLLNLYF
ncbi:MAG: hypothetical protein GY757_55780, partial [bacterium]|nr:hypothetical protein [bacterium]